MGQPKMRKLLTYFTFKSFQKAFSSAFCGLFWAMAPGYVVCFFCWLLSAAIQFCILMADDRSRHLKCIFRCLLSMTFLGWGISMPWLRWCCAQAQMKYSDLLLMAILHYGGPLNMTITNTVIVYFFSRQQAEDEESRHQEAMMQFQSVRSAQCSCPHDEQRIRLAIEGSEEEVDKVIGILVKAGAYTDQLREAYEMGSWFRFEIHVFHTCFIRVSCVSNFNPSLPQMMIPMDFQHVTFMGPCVFNMFSTCFFSVPGNDMQGAGYTNLLSSSVVAMLGWTFVAADSVSYALLVQKMELSRVWLRDGFLVLAAICCWDGSIYIYTHVCVCVFLWWLQLASWPLVVFHAIRWSFPSFTWIIFFQGFLKHLKPRLCYNRHGVSVDALGQLSWTWSSCFCGPKLGHLRHLDSEFSKSVVFQRSSQLSNGAFTCLNQIGNWTNGRCFRDFRGWFVV